MISVPTFCWPILSLRAKHLLVENGIPRSEMFRIDYDNHLSVYIYMYVQLYYIYVYIIYKDIKGTVVFEQGCWFSSDWQSKKILGYIYQ